LDNSLRHEPFFCFSPRRSLFDTLYKKRTNKPVYKSFNQQDRAWVDMRLHESYEEGGFGVTLNTVSRHAASYDQRQVCCLAGHPCPPSSAGLAAGTRTPGSIHLGCPPPPLHAKEPARGPPSELQLLRSAGSSTARADVRAGGGAAANTGENSQPQHAGSQDHGNRKLLLPQLNRLHEAFKWSQVPPACSSSGPASHSAQPNSVATPSHAAIEQALTPIQGLASALRRHAF